MIQIIQKREKEKKEGCTCFPLDLIFPRSSSLERIKRKVRSFRKTEEAERERERERGRTKGER